MRPVLTVACLIAAGLAHGAEPVFVPDFTPSSPDDQSMAEMVQGFVIEQLLADGHLVLSEAAVVRVVSAKSVASCALLTPCPGEVFSEIPARIAVVGRLDRLGETLVGHVELYEASFPDALEVLDVPIATGNEHLLAFEVARATSGLVAQVGAAPDDMIVAAAQLIAGEAGVEVPDSAGSDPDEPPASVSPPPVASAPSRGDGSEAHTAPIEDVLEGTGIRRRHLLGSEGHFLRSGLDPRDYMYRAMPHAGRLIVEIRGGIGIGDIDRVAAIRVETQDGEQTNGWYREAPASAQNLRLSFFAGYAPVTMLDVGVLVGAQYGQRFLTTGIVAVDRNGALLERRISDITPLSAINLYIQPRVRAYLVPTGPAKPFLVTGVDVRVFGDYPLQQPTDLTYPPPPGAAIPGWIGGGGMMLDFGPIVGFFAEGTYTRHFGPRATEAVFEQNGPWGWDEGNVAETGKSTVGVSGGLQFRL